MLRSITGWKPRKYSDEYSDPINHNKFVVFALVSSLLVHDAARLFRRALASERKETANEHRRQRMLRKAWREKDEPRRLKRRIDELHAALFDSCYSTGATADSIKDSRQAFPPPHWVGDARPKGARTICLRSDFPSADYLRHLVSELGYEGSAAVAALSRAHEPWTRISDRRTAKAFNADEQASGVNNEYSSVSPAHPYCPMSPALRTITGGGFKKEKVIEAIGRHNWSDKHSTAVFEIVYLQREPFLVAASLGLKVETIYQYCSRVRADLREEHTPKERLEKADSRAEDSKSFVFSVCV